MPTTRPCDHGRRPPAHRGAEPLRAAWTGVDVRVLAPSPQMAERYSAIVCLPQAPGCRCSAVRATSSAGRANAGRPARARRRLPAQRRRRRRGRRRPPRPVAQCLRLRGRPGRLPRHAASRRPRPCTTSTSARLRGGDRAGAGRSPMCCRSGTTSSPAITCCASRPEYVPGLASAPPSAGLRRRAAADAGAGRALTPRAWWRRPNTRAVGAGAGYGPDRRRALGWLAPPRAFVCVCARARAALPLPAAGRSYRVADALNLRAARGVGARRVLVLPAGSTVQATGSGRRLVAGHGERGRPAFEGWASSLWLRRADERGLLGREAHRVEVEALDALESGPSARSRRLHTPAPRSSRH
jgi:hypothetical protein